MVSFPASFPDAAKQPRRPMEKLFVELLKYHAQACIVNGVDDLSFAYLLQPVPLLAAEVIIEPLANPMESGPDFLLRASIPRARLKHASRRRGTFHRVLVVRARCMQW